LLLTEEKTKLAIQENLNRVEMEVKVKEEAIEEMKRKMNEYEGKLNEQEIKQ
jgi:hypothetical protein